MIVSGKLVKVINNIIDFCEIQMGVACLGQPRSKAQLMKLEKDPNSRYSSVGEKV